MKIFIMGMHRSGTSLVTGLLQRCGLFLGDNLLMTAKDNPRGHYEDRKFINLNNQLLLKNGGHWKSPPDAVNFLGKQPAMQKFLSGWPSDKLVGWKDPRVCITFPLWHKLIHPEKIKVVYVNRPQDEIAMSLNVRNGIPLPAGKKLCNLYHKAAWANVTGRAGVQTFNTYFHSYFENWEPELEAMLSFVGLPMPADRDKLKKFIAPSLWRNRI
jgi:hypothetical protein